MLRFAWISKPPYVDLNRPNRFSSPLCLHQAGWFPFSLVSIFNLCSFALPFVDDPAVMITESLELL